MRKSLKAKTIVLVALLCCTAWAAQKNVQAQDLKQVKNYSDTTEHTLENGLKIVVREDHRAPVVATQLWYKVGGSYEHNGNTGISHALEHMMFKGTAKHPTGEFAKLIAEVGANHNAGTSYDYTVYHQQIEKSKLPLCFELEADRMQNLKFSEDEFAREMKVVMEERRQRIEDNPEAIAKERFNVVAYVHNPHQHPVIGWMSDIEHFTLQALQEWYDRWYRPNNATLIVVGDVKPEEVFALAKQYFGPIPSKTLPFVFLEGEETALGARRLDLQMPASLPYLLLGYNVPVLLHNQNPRDIYALKILLMILDGGNGARFSERLIRKQAVAASISSLYNPIKRNSTLFFFASVPAEGKTLEELERAMKQEIDLLKTELVREEELNRVKALVKTEVIFQKDSQIATASELGLYEAVGLPWQTANSFAEALQTVTAEEVQAAAKKYLTENRLTVARLFPSNANGKGNNNTKEANKKIKMGEQLEH